MNGYRRRISAARHIGAAQQTDVAQHTDAAQHTDVAVTGYRLSGISCGFQAISQRWPSGS
jgi:hypothetical protein